MNLYAFLKKVQKDQTADLVEIQYNNKECQDHELITEIEKCSTEYLQANLSPYGHSWASEVKGFLFDYSGIQSKVIVYLDYQPKRGQLTRLLGDNLPGIDKAG